MSHRIGIQSFARRGGREAVALRTLAALALCVSVTGVAGATLDSRDDLWLRIEDARGVAGGPVTIVFRTESPFRIGSGKIVFSASLLQGTGGPGTPFSSCGNAVAFSDGDDALVSNQVFDAGTQRFSFEVSSASGTINQTPGVLAAVFCEIGGSAVDEDRFELALDASTGQTALADPSGIALPLDPRTGELRVRDSLDAELQTEDTEVKPGAVARVEIETEWAFAIESGAVDLEIDPALVREAPTVVAVPHHGTVSLGVPTWDDATGRFRFTFTSSDGTLNSEIPGALFIVQVPTVGDDTLLGQTFPLTLISADTFLVAPGAQAISLELKDGELLFTENVETEHVYGDGFSGGSSWGWSSETGHH